MVNVIRSREPTFTWRATLDFEKDRRESELATQSEKEVSPIFLLSSAGRKHFLGWRNKIIYQVFFCGCVFIAFFYVTGEFLLFIFPLSWPWIRKMIFCLTTRTHTFQLLLFLALEEETPRNNLSVLCFKKRKMARLVSYSGLSEGKLVTH